MHNILKQNEDRWEFVASLPDLESALLDPSLYIQSHGRINLHYTCHHVLADGQRSFMQGEWLFFDFDELSLSPTDAAPLLRESLDSLLGTKEESFVIVSGRGVHVLYRLPRYSLSYLEVHKSTYSHIAQSLNVPGLTFKVDPVFHRSKTLRLPGTVNRKADKPDAECFVLSSPKGVYGKTDILSKYRLNYDANFNLEEEIKKAEALREQSAKNHAVQLISSTGETVNTIADKNSILTKCAFTRNLQKDLANLDRDQWFKGVSFLTTLGMDEEAHAWSSQSPMYKPREVDTIIEGVKSRGLSPMNCETIQNTFSKDLTSDCDTCAFKTCRSPANLHNDPLLALMAQGFQTPFGKKTTTDYIGLSQFMFKYQSVLFISERKSFYLYLPESGLYAQVEDYHLVALASKLVRPKIIDASAVASKISMSLKTEGNMEEKSMQPPAGCIPMQNGLYNVVNNTLLPYSPKYFTTNKMKFVFDPTATCPNFDRFLAERIKDKDLIDAVMLFLCYAMAGVHAPIRRILVLEGPPATGKSTLLSVISNIFGDLSVYGSLKDLAGRFETASLIDKRVALFDEALSSKDANLVEVLKTLSGSETMKVEKKGKDSFNALNTARIVIACNEVPRGGAMNSGFMDRLLIVPMHETFEDSQRDHKEVAAILSEGAGIIKKVSDYYKRLEALNFVIPIPKLSKQVLEEYQESDSYLVAYLKDRIELVEYRSFLNSCESELERVAACHSPCKHLKGISLDDLFADFSEWAIENNEQYAQNISKKALSKQLSLLAQSSYRGQFVLRKGSTIRRVYFMGLTLQTKKHSKLIQAKKAESF